MRIKKGKHKEWKEKDIKEKERKAHGRKEDVRNITNKNYERKKCIKKGKRRTTQGSNVGKFEVGSGIKEKEEGK